MHIAQQYVVAEAQPRSHLTQVLDSRLSFGLDHGIRDKYLVHKADRMICISAFRAFETDTCRGTGVLVLYVEQAIIRLVRTIWSVFPKLCSRFDTGIGSTVTLEYGTGKDYRKLQL